MHYLYLTIAIISEVVATSSLKATREFTRLAPSLVVAAGYASAFYFLTLTLRVIPVGVAYALWSGLGIVLVAGAGFFIYGQRPDLPRDLRGRRAGLRRRACSTSRPATRWSAEATAARSRANCVGCQNCRGHRSPRGPAD